MSMDLGGSLLPNAAAAGTGALGDYRVNRMGFGAMRLAGPRVMGSPADRQEAIAVLRTAVDAGVNHIDTSDYYGPYTVNNLLHEALFPYPDNLVLVTKVGTFRNDQGGWIPALTPADLRTAVEDNLRHLELDQLPVVNLRLSERLPDGSEGGAMRTGSLAEPFGVLADLQREGKIRHLGVSNVGADLVAEAQSIAPVVCVQNAYNVIDRADDRLVDMCAEQGLAFVPFFPLGGFTPLQSGRFTALAAQAGVSFLQLALAWLLSRSPSILCIPGTSNVAHLRENLAAAALTLNQQLLTELDHLARTP